MESIALISKVIATLDTIEVRGYDNMDKMLGCMQALKSLINSASNPVQPTVKEDHDG